MATATIRATPQRIQPDSAVTVRVSYSGNAGDPTPNDIHVAYRRGGASDWREVFGPNIPPGSGIGDLVVTFDAPEDEGTYDVRVQWTLNGEVIVDRMGQFFTDKHARETPPNHRDCPCKVELVRIPVKGGTSITLLKWIAELFINNPDGLTLYHSALRVQIPEGDECPTYCIELTETCDDEEEARVKGEKSQGESSSFPPSWTCMASAVGVRGTSSMSAVHFLPS